MASSVGEPGPLTASSVGESSATTAPSVAEHDAQAKYLEFIQKLNVIIAQLKTCLPSREDEDEDAVIAFILHAQAQLEPLLSRLILQLRYYQRKKNKSKLRPDLEWIYLMYIYPKSLSELIQGWENEWYELIRDWKTGDDVVTLVLKRVLSGRRHRELVWRMFAEQDYRAKVYYDLRMIGRTDKVIEWSPEVESRLQEILPSLNTDPRPDGSIYIPEDVLNQVLDDVRKSGDGAMDSCKLFNGGGIISRRNLFQKLRQFYGDQKGAGDLLERAINSNSCVVNRIRFPRGQIDLHTSTTVQVWMEIPFDKQQELLQWWKSQHYMNHTLANLVIQMGVVMGKDYFLLQQ